MDETEEKRTVLYLFEAGLGTVPACEAGVEVEFSVLDATSWAAQAERGHLADRHLFQERLERGEAFWVARSENRIVSYCWVTRGAVEIGEIRKMIHPRSDEVYLYDAFTLESFRGRNLFPALMYRILMHCKKTGRRRTLISVLSDNISSLRSVRKVGFVALQAVTYFTVNGEERYRYEPPLSQGDSVDLFVSS